MTGGDQKLARPLRWTNARKKTRVFQPTAKKPNASLSHSLGAKGDIPTVVSAPVLKRRF
jgi:hypothetical protein